MRNTLFALVLPLAFVLLDVSPADAQAPPNQQTQTQTQVRPFGSLNFTADADIALAFMLISIELNENTLLTPDQVDALLDLQQILFNAYISLVFNPQNITFQTQLQAALAIFADESLGLIDLDEVIAAINNGTYIFGTHPNSNDRVWLALWLTLWAFFDDRPQQ